jgi:hypothetical protein
VIRYVVTTYPGSTGANLSKPGAWGNLPHTSVAAAEAAARLDAGDERLVIDYERAKRRKELP